MELNKKIQVLRKEKGLTQEELAELLHVSRTAISKWESGRGYPNIESLIQLAKQLSVSIDDLLSGEELLCIAKEDQAAKKKRFCDLIFGLLDISAVMLFFLPFFGQKLGDTILDVSLLNLTEVSAYLKIIFLCIVGLTAIYGVLLLMLQNFSNIYWLKWCRRISLILNMIGVLLFIISLQPYAACFLFAQLLIKVLLLWKM